MDIHSALLYIYTIKMGIHNPQCQQVNIATISTPYSCLADEVYGCALPDTSKSQPTTYTN